MTPEENFIQEYFRFDLETGAGSYEKLLLESKSLNWLKVKEYILSIKYFYFLKSSYWRIISEETKRRANWKCVCGCRESLQVHHTEEGDKHHGEEHFLLVGGIRGLVCLCNKCHGGIHNVSAKESEKKRHRNQRKEKILVQLPLYPNRVNETSISGSSINLTRKLLEEMEHDKLVILDKDVYRGWLVHRCT
jgi:hypothetical protein